MLDWTTILTSVLGSATIVSAIMYIFKKTFDKTIDYKFTEAESRTKAQVEELKRRQSILFDKMFEVEKNLLSEIYESRNLIKYELIKLIEEKNFHKADELIIKINIKEKIISDILIRERIIIDEIIFAMSHEFKHALFKLKMYVEKQKSNSILDTSELREIKVLTSKIDSIYEKITITIKKHYGSPNID